MSFIFLERPLEFYHAVGLLLPCVVCIGIFDASVYSENHYFNKTITNKNTPIWGYLLRFHTRSICYSLFPIYITCIYLTLKAPITTAADDKFCNIFPSFRQKLGMIFHENCLPADDSHEISYLICYFWKKQHNFKLSSAANYRWRFKG